MATKTKKSRSAIEIEDELVDDTGEYITFKSSYFWPVMVVLAFAVGVLFDYVAFRRNSTVAASLPVQAAQPPAAVAAEPTAVPDPVIYQIDTEGFPSLGPADAPITIVEFSDYQCPYCFRWHTQVYKSLMEAYPDQIRFVYRNFPLSFHQNAFPAAEAALCAGDQDKYWEFHDVLFDNQPLLNNQSGLVLDQANYNQYATDLGLDVTTFEECMTSHKHQQEILDDMSYASRLPNESTGETAVGGTPTFFINGHRLGGAYPIEYFKQIIDPELAMNQ